MSAPEACTGTGQRPASVRTMTNSSGSPKFRHLHGKKAGRCPQCNAEHVLVSTGTMPRHKDRR